MCLAFYILDKSRTQKSHESNFLAHLCAILTFSTSFLPDEILFFFFFLIPVNLTAKGRYQEIFTESSQHMHIKCSHLSARANLWFNFLILHLSAGTFWHHPTPTPRAKSVFKDTCSRQFGHSDLFPFILASEPCHSLMRAFIQPPCLRQSLR